MACWTTLPRTNPCTAMMAMQVATWWRLCQAAQKAPSASSNANSLYRTWDLKETR